MSETTEAIICVTTMLIGLSMLPLTIVALEFIDYLRSKHGSRNV